SPQQREAIESLGYLAGSRGGAPGAELPDPKDRIRSLAELDKAGYLMRTGHPDQAEDLLRARIEADPGFLDAHVRRIQALILMGRKSDAAAAGETLAAAARGMPDADRATARAHGLLGQMYLEDDRLADAARELELALAAPQPAAAHAM